MNLDYLASGVIGGVLGFSAKTLVDFFILSNKDSLKDVKYIIFESLKTLDELCDNLNKELFDFYSGDKVENNKSNFSILKINQEFKRIGLIVTRVNFIIKNETKCAERFNSELMNFRSVATLNIHDFAKFDFDSYDKLQEINSKYISMKTKIFIIRSNVGAYKISGHIFGKTAS